MAQVYTDALENLDLARLNILAGWGSVYDSFPILVISWCIFSYLVYFTGFFQQLEAILTHCKMDFFTDLNVENTGTVHITAALAAEMSTNSYTEVLRGLRSRLAWFFLIFRELTPTITATLSWREITLEMALIPLP